MGRKPQSRRDNFGAWLHYLRLQTGLTQEEVSDKTAIPRPTLKGWERTGLIPGREEIVRLARAYEVSLEELLRAERVGQGKKPRPKKPRGDFVRRRKRKRAAQPKKARK